jgi:hypothetical protein
MPIVENIKVIGRIILTFGAGGRFRKKIKINDWPSIFYSCGGHSGLTAEGEANQTALNVLSWADFPSVLCKARAGPVVLPLTVSGNLSLNHRLFEASGNFSVFKYFFNSFTQGDINLFLQPGFGK